MGFFYTFALGSFIYEPFFMVKKHLIILRCKHRHAVGCIKLADALKKLSFAKTPAWTNGAVFNLKNYQAKKAKSLYLNFHSNLAEIALEYTLEVYVPTDTTNDHDCRDYGKCENANRESWTGRCHETFRLNGLAVVSSSPVACSEKRGGNHFLGEKEIRTHMGFGTHGSMYATRHSRDYSQSGVQWRNMQIGF